MATRTLNVAITGDSRSLNRALGDAGKSTSRFSSSLDELKRQGPLALAAVGTAAVGAGVKVVSMAAKFESAMADVRAVSGATSKQMDALSKAAIDMGASTGMGATKAASAIAELAKGGLSADKIIRGGLKGALSLAAAGGLEVADAATATANALNLFGLRGSQATHVADAFATAANATTADVGDFALALSQGGAAAKAAGLSFDQTTVALEALASAGVKGSDAGTSLKAALTHIANPSDVGARAMKRLNLEFFDSEGRMKSLTDVSRMLRERMGGLTRQQRLQAAASIAGTDGMRALLALYDAGPRRLRAFERGLEKQGSAAEVARQKQAGLQGGMRRLQASVESLAIVLGSKLLPSLTRATDGTTRFINEMRTGRGAGGRFAATMEEVGKSVAPIARAIGGATSAIAKNRTAVRLLLAPLSNLATQLRGISELFKVISSVGKGAGDVLGGIGRAAAGAAGRLGPLGDGLGFMGGSAGASGAGLRGADFDLAPFARIGASAGLSVTSGIRPGSITSTGNQSFHATGDAIDMGGSMGGMRRAATVIRNLFGSRIRELISPFPELGIKDGRPFRYSAGIQAQHSGGNAHVHVAYTGPFGDGIGQAASAARAAGFRGNDLLTAIAIAGPESGYRNSARLVTSAEDSRGMWQINTYAHPWARGLNLADPNVAARAARRVWREAGGFGPWTAFSSGTYRSYLDDARAALGGGSSGGGASSGGSAARDAFRASQRKARRASRKAVRGSRLVGGGGAKRGPYANLYGFADAYEKSLTIAELTEGTADDMEWLPGLESLYQTIFDTAMGRGDLAGAAEAAGHLKGVRDRIKSITDSNDGLKEAIEAQTRAAQEHTAAMRGVEGELKRQTDLAESTIATDSFQKSKWIADVVSGQIGRGYVDRRMTAGVGSEWTP
jgi:TP901 family phage tail tape measure protein